MATCRASIGVSPIASTAQEAVQATRVVLEFDCEASAAVNDIVYVDPLNADKVLVNSDNNETQPSIGVILTKLTTTTCEVLVLGLHDAYTSLSIGAKSFLSASGTPTATKPGSGYVQTLGVAVSTTEIFFQPNAVRVLQS